MHHRVYQRVLYVDIDIHHGDGVEEAFYQSDRVLTFSTHKFGEYFPGTGHLDDRGIERGVNHAVNFPLKDGMDDESFSIIIKPVAINPSHILFISLIECKSCFK